MVGVEEGGADFAIADLSVTSARNDAVQFRSRPSVRVFGVVASVSKKSGQTIVLYPYCGLSRFF